MEGHGGYCLASSVLKRVQVKGQGRPLAAACEQLQVCSAGLRGPDSPALGRLGLVLLLMSSEGNGERGHSPHPSGPGFVQGQMPPRGREKVSFCSRPWWLTACVRLEAGRGAGPAWGTGGWVEGTGGVMADL